MQRKARIPIIALAALLLVSCSGVKLEKGSWTGRNHKELTALVREYGNTSPGYDTLSRPYAVFDFDNTLIVGDISLTTMVYQIENLEYSIAPDGFFLALTDCIPNIDCALEGFPGISARMLATDLYNDYIYLYDNYISERKLTLEEITRSDEFKDFRAKLWALSLGADTTFGYETGCLWILRLLSGMRTAGVKELACRAAEAAMGDKLREEKWCSPRMGEAGKVEVTVPRGLRIRKEMINLTETLNHYGIDVYICSASSEMLVEAVAERWFPVIGGPAVFGLRTTSGDTVSPKARYAPSYPHTFHEGKCELIDRFIAPLHGGKAPVLVAGDSNGDYAMLTSYPSMARGLIIDRPSAGDIAALKESGDSKYLVQKW